MQCSQSYSEPCPGTRGFQVSPIWKPLKQSLSLYKWWTLGAEQFSSTCKVLENAESLVCILGLRKVPGTEQEPRECLLGHHWTAAGSCGADTTLKAETEQGARYSASALQCSGEMEGSRLPSGSGSGSSFRTGLVGEISCLLPFCYSSPQTAFVKESRGVRVAIFVVI